MVTREDVNKVLGFASRLSGEEWNEFVGELSQVVSGEELAEIVYIWAHSQEDLPIYSEDEGE